MPEQEQQEVLCQQVHIIEDSQKFILLIILAVVLSFLATKYQKDQILCAMGCQSVSCCNIPSVFPIRFIASGLVLTALIYFFILAKKTLCAQHESLAALRSANFNYIASLLVLLAAAIRMIDLIIIEAETV